MLTWAVTHWELILGGSSGLAFLRFLPRLMRRVIVAFDCEWHREQGLAREEALTTEVKRLRAETEARLASRTGDRPAGTNASSASTTSPTIPRETRSSASSATSDVFS